MTLLWDNGPDIDQIKADIADGWITQRWHPDMPLQLLNYSHRCQGKQHWTTETKACRGLILDVDWNVVQRPFGKFFNLGEPDCPQIPNEPFEVYEKIDGNLGILYWNGDWPSIATRGSFTSWQAVAATRYIRMTALWKNKWVKLMRRDWTYVFEYIHPDNRIVVDYGSSESLHLLAVLNTKTGQDIPWDRTDYVRLPFPVVVEHPSDTNVNEPRENREGYVIRYKSGLRVKVKHDEYVYLHRLVTQMTPRVIWELMKGGAPVDQIVEDAPEQFREWVHLQADAIRVTYDVIESDVAREYALRPETTDRKALAAYITQCRHPAVMFAMLDSKPYAEIIWKMIKPEPASPYRIEV